MRAPIDHTLPYLLGRGRCISSSGPAFALDAVYEKARCCGRRRRKKKTHCAARGSRALGRPPPEMRAPVAGAWPGKCILISPSTSVALPNMQASHLSARAQRRSLSKPHDCSLARRGVAIARANAEAASLSHPTPRSTHAQALKGHAVAPRAPRTNAAAPSTSRASVRCCATPG